MALTITFTPKEQKQLLAAWSHCYEQFQQTYEPTYHVARQVPTINADGRSMILTSWINGRPTLMPPADVVSLILYDPEAQTLRTYLIDQPQLFEHLGAGFATESFPTRFFQLEPLSEPNRHAIIPRATFISEQPLELTSPNPNPTPAPAAPDTTTRPAFA